MNIVIIEDEVHTAKALKSMLMRNDPAANVIAIIDSIETGIEFFSQQPEIDLIFCDVEIADGLSFDLLHEVRVTCPVIFCTAYNTYALEAFNANGIDYILKPFNENSIANALKKFQLLTSRQEKGREISELTNLLKTVLPPKNSNILVNFRDKAFPVSLASIAYFFIEQETTLLFTEGKEYPYTKSLDELETITDNRQFYRANRQYLINRSFIKEIESYFSRKLVVKLTVPVKDPVIVSKAKASDFLRWLEG